MGTTRRDGSSKLLGRRAAEPLIVDARVYCGSWGEYADKVDTVTAHEAGGDGHDSRRSSGHDGGHVGAGARPPGESGHRRSHVQGESGLRCSGMQEHSIGEALGGAGDAFDEDSANPVMLPLGALAEPSGTKHVPATTTPHALTDAALRKSQALLAAVEHDARLVAAPRLGVFKCLAVTLRNIVPSHPCRLATHSATRSADIGPISSQPEFCFACGSVYIGASVRQRPAGFTSSTVGFEVFGIGVEWPAKCWGSAVIR